MKQELILLMVEEHYAGLPRGNKELYIGLMNYKLDSFFQIPKWCLFFDGGQINAVFTIYSVSLIPEPVKLGF